jgi:transcriptional regulator with XRE-family HTH domain
MRCEENIYLIIAENIRKERKRLCLSQSRLAERADVSLDTIKSVERGKRAMSLDTYLRIVQASETTPLALMNKEQSEEYIERFFFLVSKHNEREIEFALHMVEQLLKGQDCYLSQ